MICRVKCTSVNIYILLCKFLKNQWAIELVVVTNETTRVCSLQHNLKWINWMNFFSSLEKLIWYAVLPILPPWITHHVQIFIMKLFDLTWLFCLRMAFTQTQDFSPFKLFFVWLILLIITLTILYTSPHITYHHAWLCEWKVKHEYTFFVAVVEKGTDGTLCIYIFFRGRRRFFFDNGDDSNAVKIGSMNGAFWEKIVLEAPAATNFFGLLVIWSLMALRTNI